MPVKPDSATIKLLDAVQHRIVHDLALTDMPASQKDKAIVIIQKVISNAKDGYLASGS